MPFEDVRAVEGFLCRGPGAWAEATHHRPFVMGQRVAVLIVLSCEALDVVFTRLDWAFLRALILVRKHVCL